MDWWGRRREEDPFEQQCDKLYYFAMLADWVYGSRIWYNDSCGLYFLYVIFIKHNNTFVKLAEVSSFYLHSCLCSCYDLHLLRVST